MKKGLTSDVEKCFGVRRDVCDGWEVGNFNTDKREEVLNTVTRTFIHP